KIELDFHEIIQKFREYQTESPERRSTATHSIFSATFQGIGIDRECLCGVIHRFKECPYPIETKRTSGWKPDPKVEQKIEEKLRTNPRLKGIIDRLRQETKETTK